MPLPPSLLRSLTHIPKSWATAAGGWEPSLMQKGPLLLQSSALLVQSKLFAKVSPKKKQASKQTNYCIQTIFAWHKYCPSPPLPPPPTKWSLSSSSSFLKQSVSLPWRHLTQKHFVCMFTPNPACFSFLFRLSLGDANHLPFSQTQFVPARSISKRLTWDCAQLENVMPQHQRTHFRQ